MFSCCWTPALKSSKHSILNTLKSYRWHREWGKLIWCFWIICARTYSGQDSDGSENSHCKHINFISSVISYINPVGYDISSYSGSEGNPLWFTYGLFHWGVETSEFYLFRYSCFEIRDCTKEGIVFQLSSKSIVLFAVVIDFIIIYIYI